ncbi:MAG: carboxypeptidase regulatory-like domain-containing protein, partial [Gemmatimonadaceae bacterium]
MTTGAITGVVTDASSGAPIDGAQIQVVNRATGYTSGVITRENGRYNIQGLEVGDRYSVTARRIGFQPETRDNVLVTLSQATRVDLRLVQQAATLSSVTVTASSSSSIISPNKTGVGTTIGDSALRRLPTLNRNFTDFVRLTPQTSSAPGQGGVSVGGSNSRLNNIQIDGASSNDVFGLSSTGGQPGAQANGRAISIEAVKEYQVLLSPFDVRQGNFNGALINAVTKSGTNEFHGTAVATTRNEKMERNLPLLRYQRFQQDQFDLSIGGPIL